MRAPWLNAEHLETYVELFNMHEAIADARTNVDGPIHVYGVPDRVLADDESYCGSASRRVVFHVRTFVGFDGDVYCADCER